jgi:predicted metal-dependent HD superfamily phosphohydrolase
MTERLADRWAAACAAAGATAADDAVAATGAELVAAYASPERAYHDVRHLTEVLDHVDELAADAEHPDSVLLAAWFHDAVYDTAPPTPDASEQASAALAAEALQQLGVPDDVVARVARLVRLTATHDPEPDDRDGAVLCDADLAVLARDPDAYADYVAAVRREYAHVPDDAFRAGRAAVLQALLDQPTLFRTDEGRARWEAAARRNVAAEIVHLTVR